MQTQVFTYVEVLGVLVIHLDQCFSVFFIIILLTRFLRLFCFYESPPP